MTPNPLVSNIIPQQVVPLARDRLQPFASLVELTTLAPPQFNFRAEALVMHSSGLVGYASDGSVWQPTFRNGVPVDYDSSRGGVIAPAP